MMLSDSSNEKSTRLSGELRRFSRISRRFSVSCWAFSWINSLKIAFCVNAATWVFVLAEPAINDIVALFIPETSQEW